MANFNAAIGVLTLKQGREGYQSLMWASGPLAFITVMISSINFSGRMMLLSQQIPLPPQPREHLACPTVKAVVAVNLEAFVLCPHGYASARCSVDRCDQNRSGSIPLALTRLTSLSRRDFLSAPVHRQTIRFPEYPR